jgi:HipA-like protein
MFRKLYNWLKGVEPLPPEETLGFTVMLNDFEIGTLTADNGEWEFCYSEQFRRQSEIKPIVDFPDVQKVYRSRVLWPFFALRIPSPTQPAVRDFIEGRPGRTANEGLLLKEFGTRSVANPFRLVPTKVPA